ncbi:MAG: hypothetical protein J0M02_03425 [Planctomycetes bacterium]|nr:hypothetical protein [Planctomycetota bacterium]
MTVSFLWDDRPGRNVAHIAAHGMSKALWEEVYHRAVRRMSDKDDASVMVAEGRARGRAYRIIYAIDEDHVIPLSILPITGFPIERRGLR